MEPSQTYKSVEDLRHVQDDACIDNYATNLEDGRSTRVNGVSNTMTHGPQVGSRWDTLGAVPSKMLCLSSLRAWHDVVFGGFGVRYHFVKFCQ